MMEIGIEFREVAATHKIHAFDVVDGKREEKAICGYKPAGAMSYPILVENIDQSPQVCQACLNRKSGRGP